MINKSNLQIVSSILFYLSPRISTTLTMDTGASTTADPFKLSRFVEAQRDSYEQALHEICGGRKQSHWMWYIFPQLAGLGRSSTARFYGIINIDEARAYLAHPVLGPRLLVCAEAALKVQRRSAHQIFGSPDDLKLKSSATLFALASEPGSVFERVLHRFFDGQQDTLTQTRLERSERRNRD